MTCVNRQAAGRDQGEHRQPHHRPPARRALLLALGAALLALPAAGCSGGEPAAAVAENRVPVEVAAAREEELVAVATATGQVEPRLEVRIASKVAGRVEEVRVNLGDAVHKGDLLVKLEDDEYALQVRQAEAQAAQARAQATEAERELARVQQLLEGGAVSRQQADQAATGARLAQSQLQAAEAALELARTQLENGRVLAPADGIIASRSVDPGNLISPGTPLLDLVDISQVTIQAGVSEQDVNHVAVGEEVTVQVDALDRTFTGRVAGIGPSADARTGLFPIRVTVENPEGLLRGGMFAKVEIATRRVQGVTIPVDALVRRSDAYYVYVVENGAAWERQVEVALRQGDRAQVTGIAPGDRVVVVGQNRLRDGMAVEVAVGEGDG